MKTHSMLIGFATVFCAMQMPDAKADETPTSINAVQSKYKTGQMWSYKTRPSEKDSTFVVLGVENDGKYERKENIVYVALENLKFSNPLKSSGVSSTLIFLPVYESALNKSAKHLVKSEIALPQYADLYRQWRELRDKGVGGAVYTVSLSQIISLEEANVKDLAAITADYDTAKRGRPQWLDLALELRKKQLN